MIIGLDMETKSKLDVTKVGAYKYSMHPSTDVLMFWAIPLDGEEEQWYWSPYDSCFEWGEGFERDVTYVAWNRYFEFCMWNNVLVPKYGFPPLEIHQIIDAQDQARAHCLSATLKECCEQLKLAELKDPEGQRLINLFSKDRANPADHQDDWQLFTDYCHQDVVSTLAVHNYLPKLSEFQQATSNITMRMNLRGLCLDMVGCEAAQKLVADIQAEGAIRIQEMTHGVVERATQRARVQKWLLENHQVEMANMQAGTIVSKLDDEMPDAAREMLHIYQVCGKSSVAKFKAFDNYICEDGRAHALIIYHGAGPGRWTGTGIQFQNMPRPVLPKGTNYENVLRCIKLYSLKGFKDECQRLAIGNKWRANPMEAILSCIRTMVQADIGKVFYSADYSAIEARIAVWVANDVRALGAYLDGEDAYITMAAETLHIDESEVTDDQRFMGKQQILACQFGIGRKAFKKQLKDKYNVSITAKESKSLVNAYREKYPDVVETWADFQAAALRALKMKGSHFYPAGVDNVYFVYIGIFLYCQLPSGRRIAYPYPKHQLVDQVWDVKDEEWRNPRQGEEKKIRKLDQITYLKNVKHVFVRRKTYGASFYQSAVQGIAADCMSIGLENVEDAGYSPNLCVHDEVLAEVDEGFGSLEEFETEFCKMPEWANGLPVKSEGWVGYVYRK